MSRTRSLRRRRLLAGVAPIALALGALPLLAPTCGDPGEGFKTFSRNSIIIPMDVCYQSQTDGTGTAYAAAACPQAKDAGDVIRAYGLVYQLIRNDIAVYWVIDNAKSQLAGVDLTIEYAGGFPALFYDWSPENPPPASPPTAGHAIDYRGGPFVVDGSDYERASQVLQQFRSTFQNVNVHVSNVAFRAYAKRTMAGGWSAGGTVAPKVALLDIGSTSNPASSSSGYAKNSEPIIRGYLARAGLDFPGAGGVATDGGHGQIYDRLGMADLQPSTPGGSWTTTNLYKYGYQILWVPHWFAPGSCSNASSQSACFGSLYPLAQREQAVKTVGAFVAAGKDLFAECAGLGSFEGVASGASGWTNEYSDGDATTHFHATNGLAINKSLAAADYDESSASSPLLQLGDYPFIPRTGAIQNYRPATGRSPASAYTSPPADPPAADGVRRLVTDASDGTWDYFTYRPPTPGVRGTTVYLGGHVYSGYQDTTNADGSLRTDAGTFQIGGTRLVLNTLFNLGAACTASGVACNTGQLGVCAQGTIQCQGTPAVPVCAQTNVAAPAELCNGLDDNCNGEVDEGLEVECYDGDAATRDVGVCRAGIRSCVQLGSGGLYGMSACTGQVLPDAEVCNALDDDCDGAADEDLTQACYEGPSSSLDPVTGQPRPVCAAGTQACSFGSWGACQGQVLPRPEVCTEGPGSEADDDCDGTVNDGCQCTTGQTRPCFTGAAGSVFGGASACKQGQQACNAGQWGTCAECPAGMSPTDPGYAACQITPRPEVCGDAVDEDCDGLAPVCPGCAAPAAPIGGTAACAGFTSAEFPGAIRNEGQCSDGAMTCGADSAWGGCLGATIPSTVEACDAVDNDCDGAVDDGAVCPSRFTCLAGVCVPEACGVELPVPEGYSCNPPPSQGGTGDADGTVLPGDCGGAGPCPAGERCRYGQCVTACTDLDADGESDQCGAGSACAGGTCVAGGCYATGCAQGELCLEGSCVADPCAGALCPSGTFCRAGDCVQACTFVSCFTGEKCGADGFCEADPCAGVTCPPGERCSGGTCGPNPCAEKGCAAGQVCTVAGGEAVCVDDPCAGIGCPAGVCSGGQCFATSNPTGAGTVPRGEEEGGCGCGSGPAAALPALLALVLAPLARRRRGGRGGLALLLLATALLGTACKEEDDFDPAACLETCGEQRCVDVASDPSHCGGCGAEFACGEGEVCVDATCGPSTAVAPYVRALSRSSGPRGSILPVTVELSGDRFAQGATVRMVSGSTTRTFPAAFTSASLVSVDLDLSEAAATTWQLRVVNPDKVISNAVAFDVVIPFPSIASATPSLLTAGAATEVVVAGTNLTATTQCRVRSLPNGVPDTSLPSQADAAGVRCTVPGTLPPGTYDLWVVNEGNLASNVRQLQIASATATLAAVSPSSGAENAMVSLTVTGAGFDAASRVLFHGCAGPNDPAGCPPDAPIVGTTLVSSTTLVAALLVPECPGGATACTRDVSVRTGTGATTGSLPFTVQADQAAISTFSPATAYQGDGCATCAPLTLTFQGTNFATPTAIQVQPPGGSFGDVPVAMTTSSSSTVAAGTLSLVGRPEGAWLARLTFGDGQSSAAWPFRVLSNQAILRELAAVPTPERSGAAGTSKTSVTLEVANLRPPYSGVKVMFRGPGGFERELDPADPATATSPLVVTGPSLSLANLETGTYAFTVKNPSGATESNALSFGVTPGLPALSSLSPTSHSYASANPVVTVTLTGTNFARPDANGNGGSVVHIASPENGIADHAVPAAQTTVVSRTEIRVSLDVRDALPGAYDVSVWNPSLPTSVPATPQKSNVLADGFTIAP